VGSKSGSKVYQVYRATQALKVYKVYRALKVYKA
jgi:hypothetical protein